MTPDSAQKLITAAQQIQHKFSVGRKYTAGGVGAAILGKNGKTYTGICLDLACGIGFCAEHSAIAEMLKERETEIEAAVAVHIDGVLPPCGRCRELMLQINSRNKNTTIILSAEKHCTLAQLLPEHWLDEIEAAK